MKNSNILKMSIPFLGSYTVHDLQPVLLWNMKITCNDHTTENYHEYYSKLTPSLRTSRSTDEAAADNNSFTEIYVSYIFCILIIFWFICILDTTNMVKTCDYLYLNNGIHFVKPLKISKPCSGRKIGNKNRVKQS